MRQTGAMAAVMMAGLIVAGDVWAQSTQVPPPTPAGAAQEQQQAARARQGRAGTEGETSPISPAEVQRLFDAYFILQAQDALKIADAKYPDLLPRLKALQDVRRRHDQERRQIVVELARATGPGAAMDEALVRDRLRALQESDSRGAAELRRAYDAIDEMLDLRQRARFRVFEQNMERRKLELMLRARRGEAPAAGRGR